MAKNIYLFDSCFKKKKNQYKIMSESVQKQLNMLEKKVAALEKKVAAFDAGKPVKEKVKREPSAYNRFMSSESVKIRNTNPKWAQPDVMKEVARRWNAQKK